MWDVYLYFLLILVAVGLWAITYRQLTSGLKLLGFILLLTLLVEGYAAYLLFQRTRNLHVYHVLIPVQYVLFSWLYYKELASRKAKKIVLVSVPLFLLAALISTLYLQTIREYNSYIRLLKNILLTCWPLLYYREVFIGLRVVRLTKEPMFWISTGLFFYSLGNFFVDGLMNYLLHLSQEWAQTLYWISTYLGLFLNGTFVVSFLLKLKRSPVLLSPEKVPN